VEYRQLGRSGLRISTLTLGTMTFGGQKGFEKVGSTDTSGARRIVDRSLDAGVNLIDTADVYSGGVSEEIVGSAIEGRRDRLLLATKARFRMGAGPNDAGLSRLHLIRACEDSLRRLGTDHIDLYQVHQWDGQTPVEETMEALDTLVRDGKVRYVGCSNLSAWHVMKSLAVSDAHGYQRYVSQQIHYTLQAREAEYELIPAGLDQGLGVLVWSPLAGGLLSGKHRRGEPAAEGTRHATDWNEPPVYDEESLWRIVDSLVAIADARGVSAAQIALAWLLTRPGVSSLVIGARTEQQLEDNLAAADLVLDQVEIDRLEEISRRPLPYPFWHQASAIGDRLSEPDRALLGPHLAS
jgi:aryl-alcohol dehydrogenase-like predicted oxidoreductase